MVHCPLRTAHGGVRNTNNNNNNNTPVYPARCFSSSVYPKQTQGLATFSTDHNTEMDGRKKTHFLL